MVWKARRADQRVVLAGRTDGLGERLNALLNAIRLANLLGVDFRFSWPRRPAGEAQQAIEPAEDFFSAEFIAAHLIEHDTIGTRYRLPSGRAPDLEALRDQLMAAEGGLLAPNRWLGRFLDHRAVSGVSGGFSTEFARIGFHPRIEAVRRAAGEVPLLGEAAGLHLRAGDILHGDLETWNRSTAKIVPAPVARALTERLRAEGRDVLIFGQDQDLIDELCRSTGALDASSMRPPGVVTQAEVAMFDLALLSRCDPIISGNSGFARQAAIIADQHPSDFRELVTAQEIVSVTRTDIAAHGQNYSATQRAFAWWSAYYTARNDTDPAEAITLVEHALGSDPSNPHYRLRLAALYHRDGQHERGDDVLMAALAADAGEGGPALRSVLLFSASQAGLARMTPGTRLWDSAEILGDIESAAGRGPGPAVIYRAALRSARGEAAGAAADLTTFRRHLSSTPSLAAIGQLDELAAATITARSPSGEGRA